MSNTIDNSFITHFRKEIVNRYERNGGELREMCTVYPGIVGSTVKVQRTGTVAAQVGRSRHSKLQLANVPHDDITITMQDIYASDAIDSLDELKSNAQFRKNYQDKLLNAVKRRIDQYVIDALAATATSELSMSNKLDKKGLIVASKALTVANVPTGNRMAVISPGAEEDLLDDTTLTSRDHVRNDWLEKGYASNVMGFRLKTISRQSIDSTGLPYANAPTNTQSKVFFYDKDAVVLAVGKEPTVTVSFLPDYDQWFISVKASVGSALVLPEGVMWAAITDAS